MACLECWGQSKGGDDLLPLGTNSRSGPHLGKILFSIKKPFIKNLLCAGHWGSSAREEIVLALQEHTSLRVISVPFFLPRHGDQYQVEGLDVK